MILKSKILNGKQEGTKWWHKSKLIGVTELKDISKVETEDEASVVNIVSSKDSMVFVLGLSMWYTFATFVLKAKFRHFYTTPCHLPRKSLTDGFHPSARPIFMF
jgi:hypothetical protein